MKNIQVQVNEVSNIDNGNVGEFRLIDKNDIDVSPPYQRSQVTGAKTRVVRKIIRNFRWPEFGTISVAPSAHSGFLYNCIDGGGRLTAALVIDAIRKIPCMVFNIDDTDQARCFLDGTMERVTMGWIDRYNAGVLIDDPRMIKVRDYVELAGREIRQHGSPSTISCVGMVYKFVNQTRMSENRVDALWEFFTSLFEGEVFDSRLMKPIIYADNNVNDGEGFTCNELSRLLTIGSSVLMKAAMDRAALVGAQNNESMAWGIIGIFNKRLSPKKRITLSTID